MKEIKRIVPLSVGRVSAVIGAVVGAIAGLILAMVTTVVGVVIIVWFWFVQIIGMSLICAIGAFVGGVIYAAIYNVVAGRVGGIKIELGDA